MYRFLMLLPLVLFAQHKSPEEIAQELAEAEKQFNDALEIFDPWYTGPLITPGASMMPVGEANTQPYLFFTDTYAAFNEDRKSVGLAHNLLQLKGTVNIQTGITPNLDLNFNFATGTVNWQDGQTGGGYGDTSAVAGFLIYKQTRYVPQMKFTITQTFPTGKYKNLHSDGLNGTGAGAYSTQFGLIIAKVLFWNTPHPMNMRLFLGYQLSTPVTVKGYNAYGGGVGTHGRVHPGNAFSVDFGYEYSINQKWVVATDVVYSTTNRTKFHGTPGTTSGGTPASVGSGYSDNLSLSPAIEYNFNENLGIIAGAWFSVYGRNSGNFASGIFSVTYTFP